MPRARKSIGALLGSLTVLALLGLWLGGFTFYAAVVVPIGADELGSELEQGLITRRVSVVLNAIGLVAIIAWGVGLGLDRSQISRRTRLEQACCVVTLIAMLGLFYQHSVVSHQIDLPTRSLIDADDFYRAHQFYLMIATLQWTAGLAGALLCASRQLLSEWHPTDDAVGSR